MANTHKLISTVTVGAGGTSSISFTNIPSTYTDLLIKFSGKSDASANVVDCNLSFNSSTSSFSWRELYGDGGTTYSGSNTTNNALGQLAAANFTSNVFSSYEIYIPRYAGSYYKSFNVNFVTENNAVLAYAGLIGGMRSNTDTITSISISPSSGNLVQYSTAYLYGIKNS